jgi:hypothetical protein
MGGPIAENVLFGQGNAGDWPLPQKRMKRLIRFEMRVLEAEAFEPDAISRN